MKGFLRDRVRCRTVRQSLGHVGLSHLQRKTNVAKMKVLAMISERGMTKVTGPEPSMWGELAYLIDLPGLTWE